MDLSRINVRIVTGDQWPPAVAAGGLRVTPLGTPADKSETCSKQHAQMTNRLKLALRFQHMEYTGGNAST